MSERSYSYLKRGGHCRCSLCDATDSEEIANDLELPTALYFVEDPRDPTALICNECDNTVRETLEELSFDDEEDEETDEDEIPWK